jgi:hypothetical protein
MSKADTIIKSDNIFTGLENTPFCGAVAVKKKQDNRRRQR